MHCHICIYQTSGMQHVYRIHFPCKQMVLALIFYISHKAENFDRVAHMDFWKELMLKGVVPVGR